jgi:hypothetical protein
VTADCLESVIDSAYPKLQIIVVDNASQDGTVDFVQRTFPQVKVIENQRNLGYAAGCNVGIRYALDQGAKYIFLLNNDTFVESNLIDLLVSWAESHPNDAILTPLIRHADEPKRVWFAGSRRRRITLDTEDLGKGRAERITIKKSRAIDYVIGCAMFVRSQALREVGFFDESFFMYYEDLDLSLRVQTAGYNLRYVPGSVVWHRVEASTSNAPSLRYYYRARGSVRFYRKHVSGLHWLVILPYRLGSALKTLANLLRRKHSRAALAYLQGLRDGVCGRYWGKYGYSEQKQL